MKRVQDWILEIVVYGGGGAFLALALGGVFLTRLGLTRQGGLAFLALATIGFLIGAIGGEAGVNQIGRLIREREKP